MAAETLTVTGPGVIDTLAVSGVTDKEYSFDAPAKLSGFLVSNSGGGTITVKLKRAGTTNAEPWADLSLGASDANASSNSELRLTTDCELWVDCDDASGEVSFEYEGLKP